VWMQGAAWQAWQVFVQPSPFSTAAAATAAADRAAASCSLVCGAQGPQLAVMHALRLADVLPDLRKRQRALALSCSATCMAARAAFAGKSIDSHLTWSICRALNLPRAACFAILVLRLLVPTFRLLPDGMAADLYFPHTQSGPLFSHGGFR